MIEKLLWQMMDILRGRGPSIKESFPLALTIIAWAKLSQGDELPPGLRINQGLANEPARANTVFQQIASLGGLKQKAFADVDRLAPQCFAQIGNAVNLAMQFQSQGLLDNIDASNAVYVLGEFELRGHILPHEVADIMVRLVAPEAGNSVYVPWDFGGQIASLLSKICARVYLESPEPPPIPELISLLSPQPFTISYSDPIRSPSAVEGGRLKTFDLAVSVPPFGIRYDHFESERDIFARFPDRKPSGNVMAIRHLLAQTKQRVVVGIQNNLLFGVGSERQLREDLLRKGQIEAIIAMPQGLLKFTNIGFSVLVLDPRGGHKSIRFVDADHDQFREVTSKARCRLNNVDALIQEITGRDVSDHAVTVTASEILDNEAQLQVGRYVVPASRKKALDLLSRSTTATLQSIVQSIRPLASNAESDSGIEVFEIGANDIPAYGYIAAPGRSVRVEQTVADKGADQFLRALDIVLIIKGSAGKVGIVSDQVPPPGLGGWVAGQSAILLRCEPGSKIDPRALAMQLRSPLGQELLTSIISGATIPMIQLRELMKLQVIIPTMVESQEAVIALGREASLQEDIERIMAELVGVSSELWTL